MNSSSKRVLVAVVGDFIDLHLVRALAPAGNVVSSDSNREALIGNRPLNFEGVGHAFDLAARAFVDDSWPVPLGLL